jgi:hypothetical protein
MARSSDVVISTAGVGSPRKRLPVVGPGVAVGEQVTPLIVRRGEQVVPASGGTQPQLLASGHRPQREIARAPGQRFRDLAHQQQVRGTGEQETARPAITIDGALDGEQDIRRALHFVDGDRTRAGEQRLRIALGGVTQVEIVERHVATRPRNQRLGQGALSRLARAGQHHGGHGAEAGIEGCADQAA